MLLLFDPCIRFFFFVCVFFNTLKFLLELCYSSIINNMNVGSGSIRLFELSYQGEALFCFLHKVLFSQSTLLGILLDIKL